MKNIEILIGSPRKKGNTFTLADILSKTLSKEGASISLDFLYDYQIDPCIDCRACKKNDLECALEDDMHLIYEKIEKCDLLIIGTPIYWYGPTAQAKLFIDRLRPYFVNKKMIGKKIAVILAAGSGPGDCDLTIEMFKRICNCLGMVYLGEVVSESYDIGDALNDVNAVSSINILSEAIFRALDN